MTTEQKIVSEKDFTAILEPFASPLLSLSYHAGASADRKNSKRLHMGFLANVINYASDAEHLLDRYRARYNLNGSIFGNLQRARKISAKPLFSLRNSRRTFNPGIRHH
jgi:hypothetical protein